MNIKKYLGVGVENSVGERGETKGEFEVLPSIQ